MDIAIGQLAVVAFFFAMQSCEYSDVRSGRLSTVVKTDDVRFRKNVETLTTTARDCLRDADTVTITFRRQKNGDNAEEWRQRSNGDATSKQQLGTVGHLSRSSHGRPGNESTKLRTPRTDELENQFDHDDRPRRNLSHSLQEDPQPTPSRNNLSR